ncbi:MAG: valine--tRNA ligase [Candidatus Aenigmarchaeota archaeon]|nr:valine--tRNA ligase [Candidatus Aenigmarchaeota archaeon]
MLAKNWDKSLEAPIYNEWKEKKAYIFIGQGRPVFSIDTPPPYVNAPIHVGQATTYVYMDMFARFRRMKGFSVLFPLGLDRNGLPIEMAAEKKFGVSLHDTNREHFLSLCKKILEESSTSTLDSFLKLGISFNSWKIGTEIGDAYLTDSEDYRAMTQATFIDLWNKGLVYEDARINNYCPGCRTTLADAEIDYEELPSMFSDIKFRIKETGEEIVISTTRPELIATCAMIIFNPDDDRYRQLDGKTAITPLFGKEVLVKAHPYADMEKGTGLMMMCSFGDQADIRFFREQSLAPVIVINEEGKMNENAGPLEGLKVPDARNLMTEMLNEKDLIVSQKKISHRSPVCERSKHPIEFIAMQELYLKQVDFKDQLIKIANEVSFYSPRSRQILLDWIDAVSIDWPLSRRRYYGTEIPLWYCKCGKIIPGQRSKYVQPWREKRQCPECGSHELRGDERVFDTWFDSSSSPLYILKWLDYPELFEKYAPCSLRPQGKEIVRTWLYYTLLKTYLLTGKTIFKDAWINYHIVDETGKKMSKRLGNVIDPHDVLEKFGAEPFRLWCAVEGNLDSADMKCSYDRIEGAGKTLTKLWNVSRFVLGLGHLKQDKVELMEADKWILTELNHLIDLADSCYEKYDFHNPATMIKHFLWEAFSSHYVELVKTRAYNENKKFSDAEQNGAIFTLRYCLETLLKLLSPITPFITYTIYQELAGKDIHEESFPVVLAGYKTDITKDDILELNSTIWKIKKDNNLSLKSEILSLTLPQKFKPLEKDIRTAHGPKEIKYADFMEVMIK